MSGRQRWTAWSADNGEMFEHTLETDQSAHIAKYTYDPNTLVFTVTFKNGASYAHSQVPREAYDNMQKDHSKGKFYHAVIKHYPAVKKAAASK